MVITSTTQQQHLDEVLRQTAWLSERGYEELVRTATLVVSDVRGADGQQNTPTRVAELDAVVGGVCSIPHDTAGRRLDLIDRAALAPASK
ncbi:hypothetical protein E4K10_05265 [Streptomyces sp. T1317-0309]|nr:hypothetical protein E4K10_05265 [Streptomyces sp. T1317-0309]